MKLPAIRERYGGRILLTILILLACFAVFSIIQHHAIKEEYQRGAQYLESLQNHTPSLTPENLTVAVSSTEAYKQALHSLRSQFHPHPIDTSLTPQQFQDRLRAAVSDILKSAHEARVQLPDSFYLGFDLYQNRLPSNEAAPRLGQELEAIKAFVQKLIDLRITAIHSLIRHTLPIEGHQNQSPTALTSFPVDISFTADENRVREAFNWLITPPQFTIIRALKIRNSSPEGPPREIFSHKKSRPDPPDPPDPPKASHDPLDPPDPPSISTSSHSNQAQSPLRIILGREKITADMQLEFVETPPEDKDGSTSH